MSELPEGVKIPLGKVAIPHPSASVILSRETQNGNEILLCHRVSQVPAFPDFWSIPGGGVSKVDRVVAENNPEWFSDRDDRISIITLLREVIEEVGISPDGNGSFQQVSDEVRTAVCQDKFAWAKFVKNGEILISNFECEIITERTTPPLAPLRFKNKFYHIALGYADIEPTFPPGRSEFDEFRWWKPKDLLKSWKAHEVKLPPPHITLIRDIVKGINESGDLISTFNNLASNPPTGDHIFEFGPGVECKPLPTATLPPATHTNCYILGIAGGQRIIVDAAAKTAESLAILEAKVREIKASGSEIIATIFTHRHTDHIGDLAAISKIYQAPIWTSQETHEHIPPCDTDRILSEGDSIHLEGPDGTITWKVIETPGHCPGHICLVGDAGIISGDNAVIDGTILVPSTDGDMDAYINGLERLKEIDAQLLFPAHGSLVANPEKLLSRYIKHRKSRHNEVLNAVLAGNNEISKIAKAAYRDTPDAHPLLMVDQTLSHLNSLTNSGKITLSNGKYWIN